MTYEEAILLGYEAAEADWDEAEEFDEDPFPSDISFDETLIEAWREGYYRFTLSRRM
jgi:hypothetical protein